MVEQWPFKPFVTGSNPVRPRLFYLSFFVLCVLISSSALAEKKLIKIERDDNVVLHGNLLKHRDNNSIFLLVHGTRAFNGMEIIEKLSQKIHDLGHDVLSINLSYGISARGSNFLSCDIEHRHNEHDSVKEIILWHKFLLSRNYSEIHLLGHSRGALNVLQAASIIGENKIRLYLLAPIIDTYQGTLKYYVSEHNLPYQEIINNDSEFMISDKYPPINFLFCENAKVSSTTFRSYLDFSQNESKYPFTFNIIDLLEDSDHPIMIFSGTDDEILLDSYKHFSAINKINVEHFIIEDGDHFFRDIYLDDIIDLMFE